LQKLSIHDDLVVKIQFFDYNEYMKYHYNPFTNQVMKKFTIKDILMDNWSAFVRKMTSLNITIRKTIRHEVEKVIGCQDPNNGYALYGCTKCHNYHHVPFTCKSRFCNTCGAKYSKDRALNMAWKLLDCPHRHVVFTIPAQLRKYFAHDRTLLNILFTAAADTIKYRFLKVSKSEEYEPGMICVLHTFGRDLKWNPHIHMILCEEAIGNSGIWKRFSHINYEALRRSWQYCLLKAMNEKINTVAFQALVDKLYENHKNGFYVNAPPVKNFSSQVVSYILRYAGRPALAQSRITDYDGITVSFTYTPHDSNQIVTESLPVFDFIKRLIIHIPERYFRMIRYFGFYYDKNAKYGQYIKRAKKMSAHVYKRQKLIHSSWRKRIMFYFYRDPLKCIKCGALMQLIELFCDPRRIKYFQPVFNYP